MTDAGPTNSFKRLQPGECVKDFEFLCLGLIGFNVYIGFLYSKGTWMWMSIHSEVNWFYEKIWKEQDTFL